MNTENYDKANELRREVADWVEKTFNFIDLSVYEKIFECDLLEYIDQSDVEEDEEPNYPMWNTLFEIRSNSDHVAEAGLEVGLGLIDESDDFNKTLFAMSAGHSFYSAYWIPLYLKLDILNSQERYKDVEYSMM